jgi:D-psicose/D-tagatose/L-ribulose 3-epimerase
MRLSLSNIAWEPADDARVAVLLQRVGVDAIDIAPAKYFPLPDQADAHAIGAVRQWWAQRGIAIVGMQALLFGTQGLNLFGPPAVRQAMLAHLTHMCRIGAGLGATRLVFGSPRNRDRGGLDEAQAMAIAVPFFRSLGQVAAAHGVCVCLEPNPARYGANFMTGSADTAQVVTLVDQRAIRMQCDTGALTIDGADPMAMLATYAPLVGHVHASEPDLVTLGDGACDHAAMAAAVKHHLGEHVVTIEMVASKTEPQVDAIARALEVALRHYGPDRPERRAEGGPP